MLIVIVIIGILIASLMPRMSAAQGRARDVARKNDLNQISTALIAYQGDHSKFPDYWAKDSTNKKLLDPITDATDLWKAVNAAWWFATAPKDPQAVTIATTDTAQAYHYKTIKRAWVTDGWFVLVSHVEIPWSANYVLVNNKSKLITQASTSEEIASEKWKRLLCTDIQECSGENCEVTDGGTSWDWVCKYSNTDQLVYVYVY